MYSYFLMHMKVWKKIMKIQKNANIAAKRKCIVWEEVTNHHTREGFLVQNYKEDPTG